MPKGKYPHTAITRTFPPSVCEDIQKMWLAGMSRRKIAAAYGTTTRQVHKVLETLPLSLFADKVVASWNKGYSQNFILRSLHLSQKQLDDVLNG